jgi:hypothetical protein
MTLRQADPFLIGGAIALAVITIVIAQIGWVGPQVALIGNMVAAGVVFARRSTVQRWLRPHPGRGSSTAARRVTEVVSERS